MKKFYRLVIAVAVLVVTLAAGILIHRLFFKPKVWLATSSPNETYTVELTGDKGRGGFIFESTVRFNARRNGQTIVANAYAHSGDFMDISFELAYPDHAWIGENVLKFWRNAGLPNTNSDTLFISNNSGKEIKYLRVLAADMFLIFDMPPNSILQFHPSHQSWLSWIASEGEFMDGQRIAGNGVNFFHQNKLKEPLQYCIGVTANGLKIESPQLEGYNYEGGGSSDEPNVPRAKNCNP